MAEFDPYYKWLGIPPSDQPPNHYRMLGVSPFETDPDVISSAADRQMLHVRSFQNGPHSAQSQELLNEIASAQVCLLNPQKKDLYDRELKAKLAPAPSRAQPLEAARPQLRTRAAPRASQVVPVVTSRRSEAPFEIRTHDSATKRRSSVPLIATLGLLAFAATLVGAFFLMHSEEKPSLAADDRGDPASQMDEQRPPSQPTSEPTEPEPVKLPGPLPQQPKEPVPENRPVSPEAENPVEPTTPPPKVDPADDPSPAPEQPARLAVPTPEARQQAEKLVAEVYGDRLEAAGKPAAKVAIVEDMLVQADDSRNDPAAHFVLLRESKRLALAADRPDLALRVATLAGQRFELDEFKIKLDTLIQAGEAARDRTARHRVAEAALAALDEALRQERFDWAAKVAQIAATEATLSGDKELAKQARSRADQIAALEETFHAFQQAGEVLAKDPDDAVANLERGRFVCFMQGDWEQGLPLLSKGNDAALKSLALEELAGPTTPQDRSKLADAWFAVAQTQTGPLADAHRARAAYWYALALPDLTGLTKRKVERQLKLIGPTQPPLLARTRVTIDPTRRGPPRTFDDIRIEPIGIMQVAGRFVRMFPDCRRSSHGMPGISLSCTT